SPAPTAIPTTPSPPPVPGGATTPSPPPGTGGATGTHRESSVDRVQEHLRVLAGDIGSRVSTEQGERDAAQYIARVLRDAGYDVAIERFPVRVRFDDSFVELPGTRTIRALSFQSAPVRDATGPLVHARLGRPEDFASAQARGAIALLDRGQITFADKVRNAEAAGAVGVIVVNNVPGPLGGSLGQLTPSIPALTVALESGDALDAVLGQPVTLRPVAGTRTGESQNVVARAGAECRVLLGAHYDSVAAGPGANDNASGTATMIELARTHRASGLCAVAFGSEEVGLFGSRAYASSKDLGAMRYVLNFDMTGKVTGAIVVGDRELATRVVGLITAQGDVPIRVGSFPSSASSDHASFVEVGIPAVTFNSGDDAFIHTARDDLQNVDRESLRLMLRTGDIAVAALLADAAAPR
ncbi:MAG: M28 family peptidase, partial [Chloroflexi bacterium]|nr:M28 family peptidase [Chloroflexota bacterium]